MCRACIVILAALPLLAADFRGDVEYARAGEVSLKLDASIPDGPGPFPAAILVHGGAWRNGDKRTYMQPMFAPLSSAGFAWFSINYRMAPGDLYPAALDDLVSAIRPCGTATNVRGDYAFQSLAPGWYDVRAELHGHYPYTTSAVV
jgi:hypothetical protein